MKSIEIIERIEGEAILNCKWENKKIVDASINFLNFRGFEYILKGKSPLDTLIYTPRICGICGQAHLNATVQALENIYENINEKLEISSKAKILREVGLNIEIIDSHIKWFYMFIFPDIIKLETNDLSIYEPLKGKRWLEACSVASNTIKALAIIAGQWPHTSYMLPGGVMSDPTLLDLTMMNNYLDLAMKFIESSILGLDIENYLSFESINDLEKINADIRYFKELSFKHNLHNLGKSHNRFISLGESSFFKSGKIKLRLVSKLDYLKIQESDELTFSVKDELNDINKKTWSKSVTYNNNFFETGPMARAIIQNRKFIKELHKNFDDSVFTRVMSRVDEMIHLLYHTKQLISKIDISEQSYIKPKINLKDVSQASAISVVEACRGSLYHNVGIKNGKIDFYDVITPTVWNLGYGTNQQKGVAQKAIINSSSLDVAKIILRSFDVCSVCTTH